MASGIQWMWRVNGWVIGRMWESDERPWNDPRPRRNLSRVTVAQLSMGTRAYGDSFVAPTRADATCTPVGAKEAEAARAALAEWLRAQATYAETGRSPAVPWGWGLSHSDFSRDDAGDP